MHIWLRGILLITLIGLTKAHLKLLILAALGLAGLWMMHILAQDYQMISQSWNTPSTIKKFFTKRHINTNAEAIAQNALESSWKTIIANDPLGCAQNLICELSRENYRNVNEEETSMYLLTRSIFPLTNLTPEKCNKFHFLCPYSRKTMMKILSFNESNK